MKYIQLTKEQLEAMCESFARFLATQQITADEWQKIKKETPQIAEDEINIFSDLVWEKVLTKANYLAKRESQSIFLFKCEENEVKLIGVRINQPNYDLTTSEGLQWLNENLNEVSVYKGKKTYQKERNLELFELIKQGATLENGDDYERLIKLL